MTKNGAGDNKLNCCYVNTCGLKSKLLLPEFETFLYKYDIIGIGETKLCEHDIIQFPGYKFFSKPRASFLSKSGGLGIFIKNELLPFTEIIEIDSEYLMILKISNLLYNSLDDTIISFVYLPPEGSYYSDSDSLLEIERDLLPFIENTNYFYFIGDCNARVGTSPEFNIFDINHSTAECYEMDNDVLNYLNNAYELSIQGIQLSRNSMDKTKNNYGNKLLQFCKHNNLYICNGRLKNDSLGSFTTTRGSVVDYLISTINGMLIIDNFEVHGYSPFLSDIHRAISFTLKAQAMRKQKYKCLTTYKKWENSKRNDFINNIDQTLLDDINVSLQCFQNTTCSKAQIEKILFKIKQLFLNSAKKAFKRYTVISKKIKNSRPWFGLQCHKAQRRYYLAKRNNFIQKSETSKRRLISSCKKYKVTVRKYHTIYMKNLQTKIRQMRTEKPKQYWKLINSIEKNRDEIPVTIDCFYNYYKELNTCD